jgi:hypothetical protein
VTDVKQKSDYRIIKRGQQRYTFPLIVTTKHQPAHETLTASAEVLRVVQSANRTLGRESVIEVNTIKL